jgi:hypothetical protein
MLFENTSVLANKKAGLLSKFFDEDQPVDCLCEIPMN